jgi:hypothetical protein
VKLILDKSKGAPIFCHFGLDVDLDAIQDKQDAQEDYPTFKDWFPSSHFPYSPTALEKIHTMRTYLSGQLFFDLLLETVELDAGLYPPKTKTKWETLFEWIWRTGWDGLRKHCLVGFFFLINEGKVKKTYRDFWRNRFIIS